MNHHDREALYPRLDTLIIDDLMEADLPAIAWSGGPGHLGSVARYLARVASGEVEYLAVRTPDGRIVAKGAIDYVEHPGYGTMLQLAANPTGHGYGTFLIQAMEARIRARGVDAMLGVESNNPGALRLYQRLGYIQCGTEDASWETTDAGGRRFMYRTTLTLLRKQLS
jgi:ribosomal protein S18 acetylase RimI-like enzyme